MSSFVKQVAHYFQNFLETDFRKRRLPKRNIVLRNKDGAKISINLDKYKNFKRTLISQLEKPDKFEFKFDIKLKQYSANIEKISTKYIVKKVADDLKRTILDMFCFLSPHFFSFLFNLCSTISVSLSSPPVFLS